MKFIRLIDTCGLERDVKQGALTFETGLQELRLCTRYLCHQRIVESHLQ